MWASRDGYADVVRALLAKGADASIKNHVSVCVFLVRLYYQTNVYALFNRFWSLCWMLFIVQSGKRAVHVAKNEAIKALFRSSVPAASTPASTTDSAATLPTPSPVPISPKMMASVPVVIPAPPVASLETPQSSPKKDNTKEKPKEKTKDDAKDKTQAKSAHVVYPAAQDAFAMESPMVALRRQSSQSNQSTQSNTMN